MTNSPYVGIISRSVLHFARTRKNMLHHIERSPNRFHFHYLLLALAAIFVLVFIRWLCANRSSGSRSMLLRRA